MSTTVKAVNVSADVTAVDGPCRLRAWSLTVAKNTAAGNFFLRDGNATATILANLDTPETDVSAGQTVTYRMPGLGIRVPTKLYVDVPTGVKATIFYDG